MQRKEFEDRVCNFIVQEALVQPGDGVVIGVSGGADSVALLRFFRYLFVVSMWNTGFVEMRACATSVLWKNCVGHMV